MKNRLAIGGLIIVTVIWGGGFVASDMALESLHPFQILTARFLLGTVLMGAVSIRSLKGITKKEALAGGLMGVTLFAGFVFQIVGLQYTTPSKNAFLTALNVVMVPFIAFLILKKRVGIRGVAGALMSVGGVALLSLDGKFSMGIGDGLTLICAVGFAFQIFLTGEFVKKYRVAVLNFIQMATAFLLSAVCMAGSGEMQFEITAKGGLSVLYLGVVSTTVCYLLQTTCQKYVEETKAAIIMSMESVFGTIFSVIILHEVMTLRMVLGSAVILAALVISNLPEAQGRQEEAMIE
ncbi:drug/metabolite transporter (DMT)-like permease [Anaerotaenia torta]|uniref:DMT family transporter n=1 Tax=Anaerotaenia torta TaxID=433293 RepID=UPI003D20473D